MLEDTRSTLVHGTPGALHIVLHPRAYNLLSKVSRVRMPDTTFAALVGTSEVRDEGTPKITVSAAVPLEPVMTEAGKHAWETLSARLSHGNQRIVGWFYADPGIGTQPPRVSPGDIQNRLADQAEVLLLSNPLTQSGGFFFYQNGAFIPAGGFYEPLDAGAESQILWSGEVPGATRWLQTPAVPREPEPLADRTEGNSPTEAPDGGVDSRPVDDVPVDDVPVDDMPPEMVSDAPAVAEEPVAVSEPAPYPDVTVAETVGNADAVTVQSVQSSQEDVPLRVRRAIESAQAAISALALAQDGGDAASPSDNSVGITNPDSGSLEKDRSAGKSIPDPSLGRTSFSPARLVQIDPPEEELAAIPTEQTAVIAANLAAQRRNVVLYLLGLVVIPVLIVIALIGGGFFGGLGFGSASATPVGNGTPLAAVAVASKTATPTLTVAVALTPTHSPSSVALTATATSTRLPSATPTQVAATSTSTIVAPSPTATLTATAPPSFTHTAVPTATKVPPPPPPPPPAPTATPTPRPYITYVVQTGDTLTTIATRYGTTVNVLVATNRLGSTVIYRGQVLVIPVRR